MTKGEAKELVYVCPYHGRRDKYDKLPDGSCRRCVNENPTYKPAKLRHVPYKGHAPRWKYDCERCKFAWCCAPQCMCSPLIKGKMPKKRRAEVKRAEEMYQRRGKMPRKPKPVWKRRSIGKHYEWMLTGQHPKLVTALAQRKEIFDGDLELRIILDPRTGKPWTSNKKMREWLSKAMKL